MTQTHWIQTLNCDNGSILWDSLKICTLSPLWLVDSNWSQSDSNFPRLVPAILEKKKLHSFIMTHLDDGSHLQILPCWIQTPCFLLWESLKNILSPLWLCLKLIQSDSNSFILTQLNNGRNLEFCQFAFSHLSFPSQTHSHLPKLVPTISKKNFTHSFSINLMMAAILNSAMLDSDTAILDSDTLLSSLRFTQKDSPSTLTLTQTNSIWFTRWWQPSWIIPS